MLRRRAYEVAQALVEQLARTEPATAQCLEEVRGCVGELQAGGVDLPSWEGVWHGQRPVQPRSTEPGEWRHGWQHFAASKMEHMSEAAFWCLIFRLLSRPCLTPVLVVARVATWSWCQWAQTQLTRTKGSGVCSQDGCAYLCKLPPLGAMAGPACNLWMPMVTIALPAVGRVAWL